jgi:hypothetical protein
LGFGGVALIEMEEAIAALLPRKATEVRPEQDGDIEDDEAKTRSIPLGAEQRRHGARKEAGR